MQNEFRARDDAVRAFFLNPRKTTQGFVGDIFAKTRRADFRCLQRNASDESILAVPNLENHRIVGQNFPQRVMDPPDGPFLALGHDDLVRQQIVDGGSPQNGRLSAGVFRNVAPDARRPGTGRIRGKNQSVLSGQCDGLFGDHPGFKPHHLGFLYTAIRIGDLRFNKSQNVIQFLDI